MDGFDYFALCVAVFCVTYALLISLDDGSGRLNKGVEHVKQTCGGYAQYYDVQDEYKLVYSCSDGKLRTYKY